jgi:hypothetical protein
MDDLCKTLEPLLVEAETPGVDSTHLRDVRERILQALLRSDAEISQTLEGLSPSGRGDIEAYQTERLSTVWARFDKAAIKAGSPELTSTQPSAPIVARLEAAGLETAKDISVLISEAESPRSSTTRLGVVRARIEAKLHDFDNEIQPLLVQMSDLEREEAAYFLRAHLQPLINRMSRSRLARASR